MRHRIVRAMVAAAVAALGLAWHDVRMVAQVAPSACGTDMRMLVVSADGNEADLPAIRAALDYVGTPYDVYIATQQPGGLTPARLSNGGSTTQFGCRALYQGVILTTGDMGYFPPGAGYASALTAAEFQTLANYEITFAVRQVTWYTFPTPDLGFNFPSSGVDTSTAPISARLTAAGATVFPYLRSDPAAIPIPIQYAWTYLTTPFDASTTPVLADAQGHSLAAIHTYSDGRVNLAMTFDSNPYLIHSMLLSYGIVNWVTGGFFIGDRHVYMSPQVDDLFIDDEQWLTSTACGTNVDNTGVTQRITGADLTAVSSWQTNRRRQSITANLRLTMAFNGLGTTPGYTLTVGSNDTVTGGATTGPLIDTLTLAVPQLQPNFYWVSHTYDHENLDAISYPAASAELTMNNAVATQLGLTNYSLRFLVQPDVSGLANSQFLQAAYDNGLRYLLSNTSVPGGDNPTPNTGRWNALQPGMFVIPRRANNLFFNVATPADWVAEYNCIYYFNPATRFFPQPQTYSQILDFISQEQVGYLLRGELDPWMFHQTNLAAYDGVHTLLTDLLDATLTKYSGWVSSPVVSPTIDVLGARMANRTVMRAVNIGATIQPGIGLVLTSPVDVTVPVTGLRLTGAESYGGQWISSVTVRANQPLTVPLTPTNDPSTLAPLVNAGASQTVGSGSLVTLIGTASDPNTPPRPLTITWTQTSGPAVTLSNPNAATTTFTAPTLAPTDAPATLGFRLTVSNGQLSVTSNTVVVVQAALGSPAVAGTVSADGFGTRVSPAITVGVGDLLAAFVSSDGPAAGGQAATVSGSGLTWTLVKRANARPSDSEIWSAIVTSALTTASVTSTPAISGFYQSLTVVRFTGAQGIGASAANSAATGAPTVSLVTTKANSFVFAVGSDWDNAIQRTVPAGQAKVHEILAPVGDTLWVQNLIAPVPAALTPVQLSDTAPTTDQWNFAAVEILMQPSVVQAPVTNAGAPQTIGSGAAVTLAGSASDPNTPPRLLTIAWTQTSGPTVTLSGADTVTPTFTAPTLAPTDVAATLGFKLTASNGVLSGSSTTTVVVQPVLGALAVKQVVFSDGYGQVVAPAINVGAGELVVAFVSADGPTFGGQTSTVADGTGLPFTLVKRANGQLGTAEVWSAIATATTTATVRSTPGSAGFYQSLTVVTFTGAGGIGASAAGNAATGAPTVGLVTTKAGSFVFGVGNDWDRAVARTVPADQVKVHESLGANGDTLWVQKLIAPVPAAGAPVQLTDTAPTTDRWNFVVVEIVVP